MTRSNRPYSMLTHVVLSTGVVLAVLTPMLALPGAAYARNLLTNGGFAQVDVEGMPVGWRIFQANPADKVSIRVAPNGYKSRNCVLMESGEQFTLLDLYAPPLEMNDVGSDRLLFTCYYRTEQEPNAQMSLVTFAEPFQEKEWRTPALQAEAKRIPPSEQWSLLSWKFEALPGAHQIIPILRVSGPGKFYVDDVALHPYPDEVSATITRKGALYQLPDKRRTTVDLANHSSRPREIQVLLIAVDPRGRGRRVEQNVRLKAGGRGILDLDYALPIESEHTLQLVVRDSDSGEIYEHHQTVAPGLIAARFTQPAFRSTLLPSIPTDNLEISGQINAVESVARRLDLSAEISEIGTKMTEQDESIRRITPTHFTITVPAANLLSGDYTTLITATTGDGQFTHSVRLPLRRLIPSAAEVGYDHHHRLWVNGSPILPRGLYYVCKPTDLAPIVGAGFNFAVVPSTRASYAFADEAQNQGISLVVSSPRLLAPRVDLRIPAPDRDFWENLVAKLGGNSALLGWYVLPRPDQQTTPPEVAAATCQQLKMISPAHPTLMALASPSLLRYYSNFADIVVAGSLPVPRAPITSVARMVDAAVEATDGERPVWAAIQVAGPAWYQNKALDPQGSGRAPTPAEVRAMTYLALAHGAKGLIYYGYDIPNYPNTRPFRLPKDAPELWAALPELNRELQWLAPVFLGGTHKLMAPAAGGDLHLARWHYDGGDYIVAINTSDRGLIADFALPEVTAPRLNVMFERRVIVRTASAGGSEYSPDESAPVTRRALSSPKYDFMEDGGSFQDSFAPYEVHIYSTG